MSFRPIRLRLILYSHLRINCIVGNSEIQDGDLKIVDFETLPQRKQTTRKSFHMNELSAARRPVNTYALPGLLVLCEKTRQEFLSDFPVLAFPAIDGVVVRARECIVKE